MPILNAEIARLFERTADLLELEGANPFRVRAYRNAARTVAELSRAAADMLAEGVPLVELPGVGKDLAGKIEELVRTGTLSQLAELEARTPPMILTLLRIPGLGPKKLKVLRDELGVDGPEALRQAAEAGRVRALHGFGEKTERQLLEGLGRLSSGPTRLNVAAAEALAADLHRALGAAPGAGRLTVAGSLRRRRETVGDLDVLATCAPGAEPALMDRLAALAGTGGVLARGDTKSSVVLGSGFQVDLRVVAEESYGAALQYFTGSQAHNVALRALALKRGLKVNEYGVFRGEERLAGRTEEEVYAALGLPYVEPELREGRGELEAARDGRLPRLLTREDLKGDLHAHTRETDGRDTLEDMAAAAQALGYEYLAVTDHSKRLAMVRGLDGVRLARQRERIARLNEDFRGFRLLAGVEVDVLEDGTLDLDDGVLRELDWVVCSVHHRFDLPAERQTERLLRALDNPHVHALAHPTGRLLGQREPYPLDLERLLEGARARGVALELNSQPDRLDLDDGWCRRAREHGVKIVVSTDAHSAGQLEAVRFGVGQARRGWLEAGDVLNTRGWEELREHLRRP